MRRLALLLVAPWLLSAADPLRQAEAEARAAAAEQQRLERQAARARSEAEQASAAARASAQAIVAADARIAASEAAMAELERRRLRVEQRLAEARAPAAGLIAGLVQLGRRPQWLALANAGSAEEQVRLAALVRHVRPEVDRRTAGLRGEYQALQALAGRQGALGEELRRQRVAATEARSRFAALERQALATAEQRGQAAVVAGDAVLGREDRLAQLQGETAQRREAQRLAAALAELPAAEPRPAAGEDEGGRPPFAWTVPASGRVVTGLGELLPNGVRSRGITIDAARGTQVVAPAAGRIAFAGPFRRRAGVIIIDHGRGWMTLLSEVRPSAKVGEQVAAGGPIGRALGDVTAELFRRGTAEPAALIARSS